jgi:hypothetical protein
MGFQRYNCLGIDQDSGDDARVIKIILIESWGLRLAFETKTIRDPFALILSED